MSKKIYTVFFSVLLILFFVLCSCATPPFSRTADRTVPDDFFGISPYQRDLEKEDFQMLDEIGAVWLRRTCRWSSLEAKQGVWDFSSWDLYVRDSKADGKKILAILGYDAPWIYAEPVSGRKITAETLPYYINYVEQVVTRYKGQIDAYEIWNEPNWNSWYGTREEFYALTIAAAKKIREIDPQAKIVAGSFWRVPDSFVRGLFNSGAMEYADAISFHPYALNPAGTVNLFDKLEKILAKYNYGGEVWVTEVGYPTGGWYPTAVKEKNFPRAIIKTLAGLAVRNVRAVIWYEFKDGFNLGQAPSKMESESFFGIATLDRIRKNGYWAWALCARNLAGTTYRSDWPLRENLPDRTVSLCFTGQNNKNVLIIWNENGGNIKISLDLQGDSLAIYDISTGQGRPLMQNEEIVISEDPVFITWYGNQTPLAVKL